MLLIESVERNNHNIGYANMPNIKDRIPLFPIKSLLSFLVFTEVVAETPSLNMKLT